VNPTQAPAFLPALLGGLFQRSAQGELALEQNDGDRRLFFSYGKLVFLQSGVAGEQFGNYLLRQGVLDLPALKELLADPREERLGEKVVSWGLLTSVQRNEHLASLYDLILLNALEHPVVSYAWREDATASDLAGGVPITLDHRQLVWRALTNLNTAESIPEWLSRQPGWQWQAPAGLLSGLGDLPIDPEQAYALSFLGAEPLSFDMLVGASNLEPAQAARLVLALWAIGALTLAEGELPSPTPRTAAPEPPTGEAQRAAAPDKIITGKVANLSAAAPAEPKPLPFIMPAPAPAPAPAATKRAPTAPLAEGPEDFGPIEIVDEENPGASEIHPGAPISLDAHPAPPPRAPAKGAPAIQPVPGDSGANPAETENQAKARKLVRAANNLLMQERPGDAIQSLEQAVRLDPDSPAAFAAWLLLGKLRTTNPAWSSRAMEALQTASRLDPKAAEPWAVMGEIYHRKGFRANAQGCFKKAIELDPSVPVPPDFILEDREPEAEAKPAGGMFGKLKGLMKF
jgi:tetratricopeptide (TPR) repeat protein